MLLPTTPQLPRADRQGQVGPKTLLIILLRERRAILRPVKQVSRASQATCLPASRERRVSPVRLAPMLDNQAYRLDNQERQPPSKVSRASRGHKDSPASQRQGPQVIRESP